MWSCTFQANGGGGAGIKMGLFLRTTKLNFIFSDV